MKFEIEIAGPKNEQQYFSPAGELVRGRWHVSNVSTREQSTAMRALNTVVEIPGQRILLDVKERVGMIVEPLKDDAKGREKLAEMNKVFEEHQEAHGGAKEVNDTKVYRQLNADQVKTWLHHMRQIIDNNMGRSVGALDLPKLEDIAKMPGKRIKDPGNTGSKDKDLRSEQFVDEVPVA